jgi:hypothetical protein
MMSIYRAADRRQRKGGDFSFEELLALLHGRIVGDHADVPCPLCGPLKPGASYQRKRVLRIYARAANHAEATNSRCSDQPNAPNRRRKRMPLSARIAGEAKGASSQSKPVSAIIKAVGGPRCAGQPWAATPFGGGGAAPSDLVASFRSTLAEALEASLLLFVVDASDAPRRMGMLGAERPFANR